MQRAPASRPAQPSPPHAQVRLSLAERRRQLIDAARRVFAEHGFRGATTRQIAAEAGVTEALIFQHFPDKDSLYAAILDEQASEPHADRWLAELEHSARTGTTPRSFGRSTPASSRGTTRIRISSG